jgi:hypothetical protein
MENKSLRAFLAPLLFLSLLSGCAESPTDYTEFIKAKPRSILILPPINNSPEVHAGNSFSAWSSIPVAEEGYYVLPVALTTETFRQNGMTEPSDIQALPIHKLRAVFGADAAMYLTIEKFGTSYAVLASQTQVKAHARLVDLRTGSTLWRGAVDAADGGGASGDLVTMLITAAVDQVAKSASDYAHNSLAGPAANLLYRRANNGLLPGPYYPVEGEQHPQGQFSAGKNLQP